MTTHHGSCHCGAVTFSVEADFTNAISCNCSHCYRKGMLLAFVPRAALTVITGLVNLTEYRFNKHRIAHLFCKTCGVQPFGFGSDKEGNETAAINLRCLPDLDLSTLEVQEFNGKDY